MDGTWVRELDGSAPPVDATEARRRLDAVRGAVQKARRKCTEEAFDYARKCVNPYELLPHVDAHDAADHRPRNRAYYKMLELAATFPGVREACAGPGLHLCEAPGSFVDAAARVAGREREWHATSLALADSIRFYDHLVTQRKANGHARVIFGDDGTGDLRRRENALCVLFESGVGAAALVTADGGVELRPGERNDQEALMAPLLAAEAHTALRALQPNGCFVLKLYDTFAPSTRRLVAVCASAFRRAHLARLRSSRACNSERYLVCEGLVPGAVDDALAALEPVAFGGADRLEGDGGAVDADILRFAVEVAGAQVRAAERCVPLTYYLFHSKITSSSEARRHHRHTLHRSQGHLRAARRMIRELYDGLCGKLRPDGRPGEAGPAAADRP